MRKLDDGVFNKNNKKNSLSQIFVIVSVYTCLPALFLYRCDPHYEFAIIVWSLLIFISLSIYNYLFFYICMNVAVI